jgi:hypothetical protein
LRYSLDLKRFGAQYSNQSRYFNIEVSRRVASLNIPHFTPDSALDEFRVEDRRQAIINYSLMDPRDATTGGAAYPEPMDQHFQKRQAGNCVPLEKRYGALIRAYTSREELPETWLADVTMPWGRDEMLSQLVEMLPTGELDEFGHPACVVVRHAWRIEPAGLSQKSGG